jgi:hypothetical protein
LGCHPITHPIEHSIDHRRNHRRAEAKKQPERPDAHRTITAECDAELSEGIL